LIYFLRFCIWYHPVVFPWLPGEWFFPCMTEAVIFPVIFRYGVVRRIDCDRYYSRWSLQVLIWSLYSSCPTCPSRDWIPFSGIWSEPSAPVHLSSEMYNSPIHSLLHNGKFRYQSDVIFSRLKYANPKNLLYPFYEEDFCFNLFFLIFTSWIGKSKYLIIQISGVNPGCFTNLRITFPNKNPAGSIYLEHHIFRFNFFVCVSQFYLILWKI
jgi:hypothetical protein